MFDNYSVCGLCGAKHLGSACPPSPCFIPRPYVEARNTTVYIVQYQQPPIIVMPDGTRYETLDYVTLVKLVYTLRDRINELETMIKGHDHDPETKEINFWWINELEGAKE